jgi:hypothetical protein
MSTISSDRRVGVLTVAVALTVPRAANDERTWPRALTDHATPAVWATAAAAPAAPRKARREMVVAEPMAVA